MDMVVTISIQIQIVFLFDSNEIAEFKTKQEMKLTLIST